MSTMPYVRPHLIREVMNIIRLRGDGDAMLQLALANEEHLRTLNYIAENHFAVIVNHDQAEVGLDIETLNLRSSNQGLLYLASRYAKKLRIGENGDLTKLPEGFPTENITELCIDSPTKVDIQLLASMPNLETVNMKGGHPELFHHTNSSSIQLERLQRLKMESLTMKDINKVLYGKKVTPSSHSNLRHATMNVLVAHFMLFNPNEADSDADEPPFEPFRHIKHLEMHIEITPIHVDSFFKKFPRMYKYFPFVKTSDLTVKCECFGQLASPDSLNRCLFHAYFRGQLFLKYREIIQVSTVSRFVGLKESVKSLGFKETSNIGLLCKLVVFPSAKLVHAVIIGIKQ